MSSFKVLYRVKTHILKDSSWISKDYYITAFEEVEIPTKLYRIIKNDKTISSFQILEISSIIDYYND